MFNLTFAFQKDNRPYIALTTFGFYKGGILTVNLTNFKFQAADPEKKLTPETTDKAVVSFRGRTSRPHRGTLFWKTFATPILFSRFDLLTHTLNSFVFIDTSLCKNGSTT